MTKKAQIAEKIIKYHFEFKHLMVLFVILILFQLAFSFIYKVSLQNFLLKAQRWYQQDSAERMANLTATSLELLLKTTLQTKPLQEQDAKKIIQAFNIILSQQVLQQNVDDLCILLSNGPEVLVIDNGRVLYALMFENLTDLPAPELPHTQAVELFQNIKQEMIATEQTTSVLEAPHTFHVFVPFVPRGEYAGALYMKNTPDFTFVTNEIISSYNQTSLIFTALILFGFLAMFYISSYTVRERDEAQQLLFKEREQQLKEQINYQKEALFTKRIYHTHHKAEKVMGFIKEDLNDLSEKNISVIKERLEKYANFIARVIYDMKWYDPPIQTVRNPIFRTDLNQVIGFIVRNIFQRVSSQSDFFKFKLELQPLPLVAVNEFVAWEIIEPLLQNSLDHAGVGDIIITIRTHYDESLRQSRITIADNGVGIRPDLLEKNSQGVRRLFLENISTKTDSQNSGYGCYLAYEIARQRCGWDLDAENLPTGGCQFLITIPNGALN